MQLTHILAFLAATTVASPLAPRAEVKSMMADVPEWTIESMVRWCNNDDTCCLWKFNVNENDDSEPTQCKMWVFADGDTPASESNGGPKTCGPYTVTSGWSGQFGPGNGFTVLSVVDYERSLIVWPGYTDKQMVNGQVVVPDQSYQPAMIP